MVHKDMQQRTIRRAVGFSGVGLHSGERSVVRFLPAPVDSGIVFFVLRCGEYVRVPAQWQNVIDTKRKISLGCAGVRVDSVEHLLSAFYGLGVDNCFIEIEGQEVPSPDGCAAFFARLIQEVGVQTQSAEQKSIAFKKVIQVSSGCSFVKYTPSEEQKIVCGVCFEHPQIGQQSYAFTPDPEIYMQEVAQARTFVFWEDVAGLWAKGMALGGTFENTVVYAGDNCLSNKKPAPGDCARHKVLDLLGALKLLGSPLWGTIEAFCSGHTLDVAFVKEMALQVNTD